MRTTLNLDDDVLATVRALAVRQGKSLGEVVSELVRKAVEKSVKGTRERNGIPLFPIAKGARPVTPEIVNRLLENDTP